MMKIYTDGVVCEVCSGSSIAFLLCGLELRYATERTLVRGDHRAPPPRPAPSSQERAKHVNSRWHFLQTHIHMPHQSNHANPRRSCSNLPPASPPLAPPPPSPLHRLLNNHRQLSHPQLPFLLPPG